MPRTVAQSAQEYGRGVAGGLLFSLPLLFTAEVWISSFTIQPLRLLFYVVGVGALLMVYNRFSGLRSTVSWGECAIDSVEEMGLGLLLAGMMLWLVGELEAPISAMEAVGKIVMEGMVVALGVSIGTAQLGQASENNDEDDQSFIAQLAIAFCGAVVFVASIAPTEEVLLITLASPPFKLFLIALLSLGLGGFLLYFAEFRGSSESQDVGEIARGVFSSYAIALVATALTLWFFGRFDGETLVTNLSQTVVAGLAGALGSSAGRFLLDLNSSGGKESDAKGSESGDENE